MILQGHCLERISAEVLCRLTVSLYILGTSCFVQLFPKNQISIYVYFKNAHKYLH